MFIALNVQQFFFGGGLLKYEYTSKERMKNNSVRCIVKNENNYVKYKKIIMKGQLLNVKNNSDRRTVKYK